MGIAKKDILVLLSSLRFRWILLYVYSVKIAVQIISAIPKGRRLIICKKKKKAFVKISLEFSPVLAGLAYLSDSGGLLTKRITLYKFHIGYTKPQAPKALVAMTH